MPTAAKPQPKRRGDTLLAAIVAHPDDDTARLAYADYLEKEGDSERAEFIRVQVELSQLSAWDRKATVLRFRERLLLIRHGEEWRAALPELGGVTWGKFERGFVSEVAVDDVSTLVKRGDSIRAVSPVSGVLLNSLEGLPSRGGKSFPWLQSLRLGAGCASVGVSEQLLNSKLAEHLSRLESGPTIVTNEALLALGSATHLTQFRELSFSSGEIGDTAAIALARSKHLAELRVLRLRIANIGGYVTDPKLSTTGLRTLASSSHLTNLRTLDVGSHRLTDEGVRAVLTNPTFAKLESLSFATSALTARAFEVPPNSMRLREVDLTQCVIGDAGAAAFAKLPQFSKVQRLNLRACDVGAKAIAAIAASPMAKSLCELELADNPVRSAGVQELARGKWPDLHTLSLATCGIGTESMKLLQDAEGLGHLLSLDLSRNEVGAAGVIAVGRGKWSRGLLRLNLAQCKGAAGAVLANSSNLRKLQQLDLTDNPLNSAGIRALLDGEWAELTDLRLSGTGAGDDGVRAIASSGLVDRLAVLSLNRCGITAEGLACLFADRDAKSLGSPIVQLDLSRNPELGDQTIGVLLKAGLPYLRFLSLNGIGLHSEALQQLSGTPLLAQLAKFDFQMNELPDELPDELPADLMEQNRRTMLPEWQAHGFPIPTA